MTDFDVNEWFENVFWPTYPSDLCNRKGSKTKALTSIRAKVKTQANADTVIAGLREQMRYYRKLKKAGEHQSKWILGMCVTWINGEHWSDEIGSHYEHNKNLEQKKCACGAEVSINSLCMECYDKIAKNNDWREKAIWDYFLKNNLGQQAGELKEAWINRLRQRAREGYRKIG